jgi:hypothetical protein
MPETRWLTSGRTCLSCTGSYIFSAGCSRRSIKSSHSLRLVSGSRFRLVLQYLGSLNTSLIQISTIVCSLPFFRTRVYTLVAYPRLKNCIFKSISLALPSGSLSLLVSSLDFVQISLIRFSIIRITFRYPYITCPDLQTRYLSLCEIQGNAQDRGTVYELRPKPFESDSPWARPWQQVKKTRIEDEPTCRSTRTRQPSKKVMQR